MTTLDQIVLDEAVKLLVIGYPGSGKTGSLAALANAGFNLRCLDFDNNLRPLRLFVKPEFRQNVEIVTLQDKLKKRGKRVLPAGRPEAFERALDLLDNWKYKDKKTGEVVDYGSPLDWGPKNVIVLDSLTAMGNSSLRRTMVLNNRGEKAPRRQDWGTAMADQEAVIEMLTSVYIPCSVVVNAHLVLIGPDMEWDADDTTAVTQAKKTIAALDYHLFPSALGKKLPPKIAGHFDTVVRADVIGSGSNAKYVLRTKPEPDIDIKVPALGLPATVPIETGLAQIFEALQGIDRNEKE